MSPATSISLCPCAELLDGQAVMEDGPSLFRKEVGNLVSSPGQPLQGFMYSLLLSCLQPFTSHPRPILPSAKSHNGFLEDCGLE